MTTETLEELRERLIRQQSVQEMIQVRAYEIYQMRGSKPGGEAQDWFHAQAEVLAFLIASESVETDEPAELEGLVAAKVAEEATVNKKRRTRAAKKPTAAKEVNSRKSAPKQAKTRRATKSTSQSKKPGKQSQAEETGQ